MSAFGILHKCLILHEVQRLKIFSFFLVLTDTVAFTFRMPLGFKAKMNLQFSCVLFLLQSFQAASIYFRSDVVPSENRFIPKREIIIIALCFGTYSF